MDQAIRRRSAAGESTGGGEVRLLSTGTCLTTGAAYYLGVAVSSWGVVVVVALRHAREM